MDAVSQLRDRGKARPSYNNSNRPKKSRGLCLIEKIKQMSKVSTKPLRAYLKTLLRHELLCIDEFEKPVKRKKKIVIKERFLRVTEKGFMFLRTYQRMTDLFVLTTSSSVAVAGAAGTAALV